MSYFVYASFEIERPFFFGVVLACQDLLESPYRFLPAYVLPRPAGKYLRNREGLGEKSLDPSGSRHGKLVFFGKLFHAEYGNNILEFLVALENLLHCSCGIIMLLAHNPGI